MANFSIDKRVSVWFQHRLTTLLNYDRIIVMENGAIVEDGTPQELRMKSGGKFSTMLYSSIQGRSCPLSYWASGFSRGK